jgi:hypothetical protein
MPLKTVWLKEQMRSKLAIGKDTKLTLSPLDCMETPILITSPVVKNTRFSAHLLKLLEKVDLALEVLQTQSLSQLEPPWIAWHRPLDWRTEQTQDWIRTKNLHSFYRDNCEDTNY